MESLDEAIKHCYEVSEKVKCNDKCYNDHIQLAHWLEELKECRKNMERKKDNIIEVIASFWFNDMLMYIKVCWIIIICLYRNINPFEKGNIDKVRERFTKKEKIFFINTCKSENIKEYLKKYLDVDEDL